MKQCPFENSANEKLFTKFKDKFYDLFEKGLRDIKPKDFLDEEFRDIYQRIGVDVPEEDEAEAPRVRSPSRGQRREKESDDEKGDDHEEQDEQLTEKGYDFDDTAHLCLIIYCKAKVTLLRTKMNQTRKSVRSM